MELAVRLPWMQREDVSDISPELMLSRTPTLHQGTMAKESGWELEEGEIRWWFAAEEKYLGRDLSMTYVI